MMETIDHALSSDQYYEGMSKVDAGHLNRWYIKKEGSHLRAGLKRKSRKKNDV